MDTGTRTNNECETALRVLSHKKTPLKFCDHQEELGGWRLWDHRIRDANTVPLLNIEQSLSYPCFSLVVAHL